MTTHTSKGEQRRQQVLEAASGVLMAEGFRALTHRRVALAAGVPLGTTTYYFTSRGDLVRATVGVLIEDERGRRAGVRVQDPSIPSVAHALVELLLPPGPASPRAQASLIYERLAEGVRDPIIADLIREDYADLEAQVARVLVALSPAPDPGTVLALADGRVLRWLFSEGGVADLEDLVASDLRWLG
ncbi:MAG TPA: TetR family transcriptional regulator [Motilibacterales bacterium]|nr:TetR family transcriptional regulator [Motilibacterales bacterium]